MCGIFAYIGVIYLVFLICVWYYVTKSSIQLHHALHETTRSSKLMFRRAPKVHLELKPFLAKVRPAVHSQALQ